MQVNFNGPQLTQVFPKCAWPWGQPHRHSSPSWYISPNTHLHAVMETDAGSARLCAGQGEHLLALASDARYVSAGHLLHFIPAPVEPAAHAQSVSGKNIAGVIISEECLILLHSYPLDLSKDVMPSVIINFPLSINCSASPGFTSETPWRSNAIPLFRERSKRPGENLISGLLANVTDCTSEGNDRTFEMRLFEMSSTCKASSRGARQDDHAKPFTVMLERRLRSGMWPSRRQPAALIVAKCWQATSGKKKIMGDVFNGQLLTCLKTVPKKERRLNVKFRVQEQKCKVQAQRCLSSLGSPASSKFSLGNSTLSSKSSVHTSCAVLFDMNLTCVSSVLCHGTMEDVNCKDCQAAELILWSFQSPPSS